MWLLGSSLQALAQRDDVAAIKVEADVNKRGASVLDLQHNPKDNTRISPSNPQRNLLDEVHVSAA